MRYPPAKTGIIIRRLAIPVIINIAAPSRIAIMLVSPTEPGINPIKLVIISGMASVLPDAANDNGVAPENASAFDEIHTASPHI